jgi:hypothetical protein
MAGATAQGATFSFAGFSGKVTGISVESPTAVIADMTAIGDPKGYVVMVPTGDWVGGTVTVDFIAAGDPQGLVRATGALSFASAALTVSRRVICQSASIGAQAGELIRGSLKFLITDYTGT